MLAQWAHGGQPDRPLVPRSLGEEELGEEERLLAHRAYSECARWMRAEGFARPLQIMRMRKRNHSRVLFALLFWAISILPDTVLAQGDAVLEVGKFSAAAPGTEFPENWKPLTFPKIKRHTAYTLIREGEVIVVKAVSEASSSGLTREIVIDPKEFPIVQWHWKVSNLLDKSDVTRKDGDDYPARIYITFAYDASKVGLFEKAKYETARLLYGQYPPLGALNYIWDSHAAKDTLVPNPYTERAMMIIVESGAADLNRWVTEERNVYEDYKAAFGEEPSLISGVAIMTDTDNTGESAIAFYGDIVFKKRVH